MIENLILSGVNNCGKADLVESSGINACHIILFMMNICAVWNTENMRWWQRSPSTGSEHICSHIGIIYKQNLFTGGIKNTGIVDRMINNSSHGNNIRSGTRIYSGFGNSKFSIKFRDFLRIIKN